MAKVSGNTHSRDQMNYHADQCNPNSGAHRASMDNHANQCNPNNSAYRGGKNAGKG